MRNIVLPLLAAAAVFGAAATPALANETRAEVRAGAQWLPGDAKGTVGAALGYDFDLGPAVFTGLEVSADKPLAAGYKTQFGYHGRVGVKTPIAKVYGVTGYTSEPCSNCRGAYDLGAGAEAPLFGPLYGKVEYRHLFTDKNADRDVVLAGVGVKF